jgi:hypothetical protein
MRRLITANASLDGSLESNLIRSVAATRERHMRASRAPESLGPDMDPPPGHQTDGGKVARDGKVTLT